VELGCRPFLLCCCGRLRPLGAAARCSGAGVRGSLELSRGKFRSPTSPGMGLVDRAWKRSHPGKSRCVLGRILPLGTVECRKLLARL